MVYSAMLYGVVGLYFSAFLMIIFWFFVADVESNGINGTLSRFLFRKCPREVSKFLKSVLGDDIFGYFERWTNYLINERNPVCQMTYIFILNGAYIAWLTFGQPLLPSFLLSSDHSIYAFIGVVVCHATFYLACTVDPGTITQENHARYMHTDYDDVLYIPDRL